VTLRLVLLLLTGCDDGKTAATPLIAPMAIPAAGWAITQSSLVAYPGMVPLASPSFDFPNCASAQQCWISYVEMAWKTQLTNSPSVTLNYTITGSNPMFVNDTPHNKAAACRSPATLVLLIHQIDDHGTLPAYQSYRWFSAQRTDLALGTIERKHPAHASQLDQCQRPKHGLSRLCPGARQSRQSRHRPRRRMLRGTWRCGITRLGHPYNKLAERRPVNGQRSKRTLRGKARKRTP